MADFLTQLRTLREQATPVYSGREAKPEQYNTTNRQSTIVFKAFQSVLARVEISAHEAEALAKYLCFLVNHAADIEALVVAASEPGPIRNYDLAMAIANLNAGPEKNDG